MSEQVTYTKVNSSEEINVGDVIMIDPSTGNVTKAVANDCKELILNSRLIVGVCCESDNTTPEPIVIDGGNGKEVDRIKLNSDKSKIHSEYIIISGGDSGTNEARRLIKVVYNEEQLVNVYGYVDIGDKLCISRVAGKAKSKDYLNKNYYEERSIGKVIKYTNNPEQVKVLLNIE